MKIGQSGVTPAMVVEGIESPQRRLGVMPMPPDAKGAASRRPYRCGETKITYFEDGPLPGRAWNPIEGCTPCSEGCEHCYARAFLKRCGRSPEVTLYQDRLDAPSRIKESSVIATCFQSDLFHAGVPGVRVDVWGVAQGFTESVYHTMRECERHTFVVATKRPANMRAALQLEEPLPNVWLGVTVENQMRAKERLPLLAALARSGWNTWVSAEPLLGPLDLRLWLGSIGWVAAGCESIGANLGRPAEIDWFRSLRDQCAEFGVPYYLKQTAGREPWFAARRMEPDGTLTTVWGDPPGPMAYDMPSGPVKKRPYLDGRQHLAVPWGGVSQ
jgi:protein gp37